MRDPLGTCSRCSTQAVVSVNGITACLAHLDEVMGSTMKPIHDAIEGLAGTEEKE